jgi:HEAT repeat protein
VARQKEAPPADADPLLAAFEVILPALTTGLRDPYVRNRLAALDAIELYAGAARSAVPALTRTLEDPDRFVRWAAARILGRIGPAELDRTVPGLSRLLFDPDLGVNLAAAQALERYGASAEGAVPALAQALLGATDTEKRLAIIESLGSIGMGAAPAIPALIAALSDPYAKTRAAAANLLGEFGGAARSAVPALRRALNDTDPRSVELPATPCSTFWRRVRNRSLDELDASATRCCLSLMVPARPRPPSAGPPLGSLAKDKSQRRSPKRDQQPRPAAWPRRL